MGATAHALADTSAPLDARDEEAGDISTSATLVARTECGQESDPDLVSLVFRLRVTTENVGQVSLVVAKHPGTGSPEVADTVEAGQAGRLAFRIAWDDFVSADSVRSFPSEPTTDFTVLRPGQRHTANIEVEILAQRRGRPRIPNTILEGSRAAFRVPLEWGAIFRANSAEELARVARRWRRRGLLVAGHSWTPWIGFDVPELHPGKACPSQPWH